MIGKTVSHYKIIIVYAAILALSAVFYINAWKEAPVLLSDSSEYIRIR